MNKPMTAEYDFYFFRNEQPKIHENTIHSLITASNAVSSLSFFIRFLSLINCIFFKCIITVNCVFLVYSNLIHCSPYLLYRLNLSSLMLCLARTEFPSYGMTLTSRYCYVRKLKDTTEYTTYQYTSLPYHNFKI